MSSELGAAVIGCGAIAPLHVRGIASTEGVRLLAAADIDAGQAAQYAREFGCEAVQDYRELLEREDIGVVHLCTPHHLHAQMAIEFLQAGKHVLTEKPLAADLPSARQILEAADRSQGRLGVVFQNRYNPTSVQIRQIIDSGGLGRLLCMKGIVTWHRSADYYSASNWRGKRATEGGGVLINQTIHTLDLLQWFGGEISSVSGSVSTDVLDSVIEVEDSAHASITFADNVRGLFYGTNAYAVNSPVELELVFERGTLLQRRDCLYLWSDGQEQQLCGPGTSAAGGKSYWGSGHQLLIQDFYTHIREDREFWLNGREGIKALEIIAQIYSSSDRRKTISTPSGALTN